jgi:transcriptional regulator with XRE-family HTH domain
MKLLGRRIKFFRKEQKLSQTALCDGICTQAYLSSIEKGLTSPSAYIIEQLAKRLGVTSTYLLNKEERQDYTSNVMGLIRHHVKHREYEAVEEIIKSEENNLNTTSELLEFLFWHKGICEFYLRKDIEKAVSFLDMALERNGVSNRSKVKMEIYISKANIYMDSQQIDKAITIYKDLNDNLKFLPGADVKMSTRLHYNYVRALRLNGQLEDALLICDKAIKFCKETDSMYGLGDLFFQKGLINKKQNKKILAQKSFEKAALVYSIYDNHESIELVRKAIKAL